MTPDALQTMPITPESIRARSESAGEPAWLRDFRAERLLRFSELPPVSGRYSRLRLNWEDLPRGVPALGAGTSFPGLATLRPGDGILKPLSAAARSMGQERFAARFQAVSAWDNLVLAGWEEGHALAWESGAAAPAVAYLPLNGQGGLVLEPLLLEVGDRSEASLFIHWQGGKEAAFHASALAGRVGEGAALKLFILHDGAAEHRHISLSLSLARDASVEVFTAWVGGRWTVARYAAEMRQAGASWKESHIVLSSGREHVDLDSQVRHLLDHTQSDVQVRTVAAGSSRSVFTGNILMEKEAEFSEARLADHVLLLSPEARADSIPGLEIKALDVKASHAASVGQVDAEQLFYLESRGLDPARARHLVVVGFLESLFERAPFPMIPEVLDPILEGRVNT